MNKRILWTTFLAISVLLLSMAFAPFAQSTDNVTLTVLDSHGNPLDGIDLYYNDYGSHWAQLGTTTSGNPVMATFEDGTYNIKAVKNYSEQVESVVVSGTGSQVFQTSLFSVHVKDSYNADLPGVAVGYNDYGSHYVDMGDTDSNGNATIELFPGTYNFRATKNYSVATGSTNGDIEFQTELFTVHVDDVTGTAFPGIAIGYNDYGSHYLDMGDTDASGNATIELFAGTYTFKATKNYSVASGSTSSTINFQTAKFTVHVADSSGADFAGIAAFYNDYGSHWLSMGDTDANGDAYIELFPGTFTFKASKNYTDMTGDLANGTAGSEETIEFQTANAVAYVKDCDGTPLAGFKVAFNDYGGHWLDMGTTGGDGKTSIELFPGVRKIRASIDYTNEAKDLNLTLTESSVEFNPTQVNWGYSGTIKYNDYGNHWKTMTSPFYLFPGTYTFKFDDIQKDISIGGCSMDSRVVILRLKDHNGNPLAGGAARGGNGASFSQWFVSGSTDSNGLLFDFRNTTSTTMSYEMKFNNTTQHKTQDVTVNSVFDFQTDLLTLRMETCDGTPLDGGNPRGGNGSTYTTWWFPGSATGSSAPGETAAEFFPGTYSFEMQYKATADQKLNHTFPDDGSTLTWQTTSVTLNYSGQISYGGSTGDSTWFNKPTMELLPGMYMFHFRGAGTLPLTFAGCNYQDNLVAVKLIDSNGNGLAGGEAKYYDGGWKTIGTTDASGLLFLHLDSPKNNLKFSMKYAGGTDYITQDVSANSIVTFQTHPVTVELRNEAGHLDELPEEGEAKYYASGWKTIGETVDGTISIELLPLSYKFSMKYAGGTDYQTTSDPTVTFNTHNVTVELRNQAGNLDVLPEEGEAKYYASGWKTIGETVDGTISIELLPLSYKFSMKYGGGTAYQTTSDPTVTFATKVVTVRLETGAHVGLEGGEAKYYASGWKTFGTTDGDGETTEELLPLSYKFSMKYNGATNYITQNVDTDPLVVFETQNTVPMVKFTDSNGNGIAGAVAKYYASGWKEFGITDINGEITRNDILPGTYKFSLTYEGATVYETQDISADPFVTFSTKLVTVELLDSHNDGLTGGEAKFYASGWKTFGTTDGSGQATKELLPLSYKFSMNYGGGTDYITQDVDSNPTVTFQTHPVTVELKDSTGALIDVGTVKYYASGWKEFGTTSGGQVTKELLPLSYKYSMGYEGGTTYQTTADTTVTFQTNLVTVSLKDCDSNGVVNGEVKYYASGWKSFGTTNANGETTKELLPLSYKFSMGYGGATNYITQDIEANPSVEFAATKFEYVSTETVQYYASGWKTLTGPIYMLPGTYKFKIGDEYQNLDINGCSLIGGAVTIQAVDSEGNPLSGVEVKAFKPNTGGFTLGTTDATGKVTATLPWYGNGIGFTARYAKSSATATIDVAEFLNPNPLHTFQTTPATIEVKDCSGNAVQGTEVTYFISNSGGGNVGTTGPTGVVSTELFPGTYQFKARINKTTGYADVDISAGTPIDHTFVPTIVEFHHTLGKVSMWQDNIGGTNFNGPTYIFPGTYTIDFYEGSTKLYSMPLTVEEGVCGIEKSLLILDLIESNGGGLPDGDFVYRFGYGSYTSIGTTDTSGRIFYSLDGPPTNTKVKVTYNGASIEKEQNVATNSHFVFQTVPVTAKLNNSSSGQISNDVSFEYRYGWGDKQPFTSPMELLPVNTKITVTYMGASIEKEQNAGINPDFVFATVPVTATLKDSGNNNLSGATFEYRYGWGTKLPFIGPMELLPVNTKITVSYMGASVEKEQNADNTPDFEFTTKPVTAVLNNSTGAPITDDVTFEYRYGWGTYSPLAGSTELLPVNTKVKVNYAGASVEKEQNVASEPGFNFQTGSVSGTACTQYRYGWGSYMTFTDPMELLAVSTKFSDVDGPDTETTPTSGSTITVTCP